MTVPPDEPGPDLERVVDAISDGKSVEWDSERLDSGADPETLEALRLIDGVSRLHRGRPGDVRDPDEGAEDEPSWGNLLLRGSLGAGVYGEVHRAFDPGLHREVALKLWSASVRPRIIEQLLEEARALARVRHPNVLLVHGADVHDGRVGMWTELLEGATLEQLISEQGGCDWREAAIYGIQLCRALAAVHAIGFVHRDVKAANVMRERGGRIVLMDFGSASRFFMADDAPGTPLRGTPSAMAPEVLAGAEPTPVADVYSLGALLFRLVSGRPPVPAESLDELKASLAAGPAPSLRALRPEVPLAFSRVVALALERDPGARVPSASELERLLAEALRSDWAGADALAAEGPTTPGGPVAGRRGNAMRRIAAVTTAITAVAALAGVLWWGQQSQEAAGARPMQFTLQLPAGEHMPQFANVVVSPDGSLIVFASQDTLGKSALWLRRFDALTSTRIPGTDGARYPFWSPDSRHIAFFGDSGLCRVDADGGSVRVICKAEMGRGGSWSPSGTILFAGSTQGPLLRVDCEGGTPVPATTLDPRRSEVSHRWPFFLPNGDHFLYVTTPESNGAFSLYVGALHSDRRVYVGPVESGAVYSSGMLIYMFEQALEGRPFNLRTLRWSGERRQLIPMPGLGGSIAEPHASVSRTGTLVHSFEAARESRLEWIDTRTGRTSPLAVGPYFDPSVSPDGRRILAERVEGTGRSNLWMLDARTGAAERWTDDPALNRKPVWSPSGDSIVFSSNRNGHYQLFVRATEGSTEERSILAPLPGLLMWPNDWRPGGLITFDMYEAGSGYDVYELRGGTPVPMARTAAFEARGSLSPDRRWLAYDSNVSGRMKVLVVDRQTLERYELPQSGLQPRWARRSGALFFRSPAGEFFQVTPKDGLRPPEWPVRSLFRTGVVAGFDPDADGTRLLCCIKSETGQPEEIAVIVNLPRAFTRGF